MKLAGLSPGDGHWCGGRNHLREWRRRRSRRGRGPEAHTHSRWRVRVEHHLHAPQMDGLALLKRRLGHGRAIDECAVGGTEILESGTALINGDLAMRSRNGSVGNLEIVGEAASNRIDAGVKLNLPSGRGTWIDDQSCHGF